MIRGGTTPQEQEEHRERKYDDKRRTSRLLHHRHARAPGAAAGQATTTGQASAIDQGLKDDLWASHHTYRLQEFDSHVAQANNVIGILGKYSIDTTQMQATLTTISGERAALDTALTNKDQAGSQDHQRSARSGLEAVRPGDQGRRQGTLYRSPGSSQGSTDQCSGNRWHHDQPVVIPTSSEATV